MTWVRFDDGFPEHPKVAALSDSAFRAFVSVIAYCSRQLTDGRVLTCVLPRLGASKRAVLELVRAGLLHEDGEAVVVHDYLDYQPSRAKVEADRESVRGRVSKHRNGTVTPLHPPDKPDGNGPVTTAVTPTPSHPIPSGSDSNLQRGPKDLSGQSPPEPPPDTHTQGSEAVQSQTRKPPGHVVAFERSFWPTVETWAGPTAEHQRYAREHGLTLDFERTKYTSNRKKNAYQCANFDADFQEWLAGSAERLRARRRTNGSAEPTLSEDRITASQARILAKIRRENHG